MLNSAAERQTSSGSNCECMVLLCSTSDIHTYVSCALPMQIQLRLFHILMMLNDKIWNVASPQPLFVSINHSNEKQGFTTMLIMSYTVYHIATDRKHRKSEVEEKIILVF